MHTFLYVFIDNQTDSLCVWVHVSSMHLGYARLNVLVYVVCKLICALYGSVCVELLKVLCYREWLLVARTVVISSF